VERPEDALRCDLVCRIEEVPAPDRELLGRSPSAIAICVQRDLNTSVFGETSLKTFVNHVTNAAFNVQLEQLLQEVDFTIIMTRTLELNCLVQGDDFRNAFPVKIGSHESVGTLKQRIREEKEHAFKGVDADTLVLWKVSLSDGLVKQDPRILDLVEDQSLSPLEELSEVFSVSLPRKHIHIVVRAPSTSEHRVIMACHIRNSL